MRSITLLLCGVLLLLTGGSQGLCAQTAGSSPALPKVQDFQVKNALIRFSVLHPVVGLDSGEVPPALAPRDMLLHRPFSLSIGLAGGQKIAGQAARDLDSIHFQVPLPPGIFPGERLFVVTFGEDTIFSELRQVLSENSLAGQQPFIESITPRGTRPGKSLTVRGENFGDDLNDIYIWFTDRNDQELPPTLRSIINPAHVDYLTSADASGLQTLKFSVPSENSWGQSLNTFDDQDLLEHELRMRVVVKGQPSANAPVVSIVKNWFRMRILAFLLLIMAVIVLIFWFISRRLRKRGMLEHFHLRNLVVDKESNRLSLARIQALAWTITLVISYSYFVLMTYLVLDKSMIPDFDPSLLILMGISTGGLLVARTQDRAKPRSSVIRSENPNIWDLVMENGQVSLASLQLALFTLVGLGLYWVYMSSPDLVETGLPTMPDTLLALMGISQGGYLTGKAVEASGQAATAPQTETTSPPSTEQRPPADPSAG